MDGAGLLIHQPQTSESKQSVQHQQFVAKGIARERGGKGVGEVADDRGCYSDVRHIAVTGLTMGKQSKGKQAQ